MTAQSARQALHQSRIMRIGIVVLLAGPWILQIGASATSAHQHDPRQEDQSKVLHIGNYVAKGLGLVSVEKAKSQDEDAESTTTPAASVPSSGYNISGSSSSTPSISESMSGTIATSISVPSISANGTINTYALSCYSSRYTWKQEYNAWYSTAIESKSFPTTKKLTTLQFTTLATETIYPSDPSTYKLCDGSARVDASPLTITSSYNWTSTFSTVVTQGLPTFTPAPCSMSPTDCMYLYYNTSLSADDVVLLGACGSPAHLYQPCLIGGGPVRLAYFPVTTTNGDLCLGNGSTITSMDGPSTIDALGTTLTSGSVYLSFQTLYAYQDGFDVRIGPNFTDFILPLPSSAISTQCGGWFSAQGAGTAVNWADFNSPVPASAYACENRCTTELSYIVVNGTGHRYTPPPQCYTIWDDFNPALAVPTEARDLVPEWSTCSFWDAVLPNFLFDPPIALRPAGAIASATLPGSGEVTTTSASPASTTYTALQQTAPATTTTTSSASSESSESIASATVPNPDVQITFSAGSVIFTASAATGAAEHNAFVIDGATVQVGGSPEVVEGHTVSVGLQNFVVDGTTAVMYYSTSVGEAVTTGSLLSTSASAQSSRVVSGTTTTARSSSSHGAPSSTSSTTSSKSAAARLSGKRAVWRTSLAVTTTLAFIFSVL